MALDNYASVTAFTYAPLTPDAAELYLGSFGNGAMFRTGTYVALTIVADIFIVCFKYLYTHPSLFGVNTSNSFTIRFSVYMPCGEVTFMQQWSQHC